MNILNIVDVRVQNVLPTGGEIRNYLTVASINFIVLFVLAVPTNQQGFTILHKYNIY